MPRVQRKSESRSTTPYKRERKSIALPGSGLRDITKEHQARQEQHSNKMRAMIGRFVPSRTRDLDHGRTCTDCRVAKSTIARDIPSRIARQEDGVRRLSCAATTHHSRTRQRLYQSVLSDSSKRYGCSRDRMRR